jgi:hypothetical protein
MQAIAGHAEHAAAQQGDPYLSGFGPRHLSRLVDIACENQPQAGFSVAEVGTDAGGLTRQACLSSLLPSCVPLLPWQISLFDLAC